MQKLKILFMGTPDFAVFSLRALTEAGENVVGVVTQPDQPKGRGYVLTPPPVKVYANEHRIPVYQPETLRSPEFFSLLEKLSPDVCVVAAYGKILPENVLNFPKYGCINLHGSLLPKYRGAAPMQRAIMDGEKVTGVTVMQMDAGLDTGDMLLREEVPIEENDNFETVHDKMGVCSANLLLKVLKQIDSGTLCPEKQDDSLSTYAKKIEKSELLLDFSLSAEELHNKIRGLSPVPLAYTVLPDGKRCKISASEIVSREGNVAPAGTVVSAEHGLLTVACGKGVLSLLTLLPEGKGKMTASAFLNGRNLHPGDKFFS